MESFFSSLKTERTARKNDRTRNEAIADMFDSLLVRPLGHKLQVQKVRRPVRKLAVAFVLRQPSAPRPRPQAHQLLDPVQPAFD